MWCLSIWRLQEMNHPNFVSHFTWVRDCVSSDISRLWSLSKERGGHPRRSCVGVAARRGNPGQEGRNQGRRANERMSGETLSLSLSVQNPELFPSYVSLSISLYLPVLPSVLVFLCLSLPLCLSVLAVTQAPAALTTSSWRRMCACSWLCVIALQRIICVFCTGGQPCE